MTGASSAYLEMSVDELDLLLGEALVADEFGAKDMSDNEKRDIGRRWFDLYLPKLRAAVCTSEVKVHISGPSKTDRNLLFASVVDALLAFGGFPVPVTVLSAKLVQYGIDRLCGQVANP